MPRSGRSRRLVLLTVTLLMGVAGLGGCADPPSDDGQGLTASPAHGTDTTLGRSLTGRTFRLVETWTDAGSSRMRKGIDFRITFTDDAASVDGDCGHLTYSDVRFTATGDDQGELRLGQPAGPACTVGVDPSGPPEGDLHVIWQDQMLILSNGFIGWNFTVA